MDVSNNINNYKPKRKRKNIIAFDDMIADASTNKKPQVIVKDLFFRYRRLNISLVFTTKSYFYVPKELRLSSIH